MNSTKYLVQGDLIKGIKDNDPDAVRLAIKRGADLNDESFGQTPLLSAISQKNAYMVNLLIENGADVNYEDKKGQTPLSFTRDTGLAELLIQNGADLDYQNSFGETALFTAVRNGSVEMFQFLVDNGADTDIKDYNRKDILDYLLEKAELSPTDVKFIDYLSNVKKEEKSIPVGTTKWYYYCSLGEKKVPQLRALARDANIPRYSKMKKDDLCKALANSYLQFTSPQPRVECNKNEENLEGEEFKNIDPHLIIRDNQGFCYYLSDLEKLFITSNRQPYTRANLDEVYVGDRKIRDVAKERRKLVDVHNTQRDKELNLV